MKPLFKTSHSTTYNGNKKNPVFNEEALLAAENLEPDKKGLKEVYKNMSEDMYARSLQATIAKLKK